MESATMKRCLVVVSMVTSVLLAGGVQAAPVLLNNGNFLTQTATGEGSGRGMGVLMNSALNLTSIGVQADLNALSFDVQVYGSTNGSNTTGLLANSTANLGGGGYQWWDIGINFALQAGQFYVFHFRPTVSTTDWVDNNGLGTVFYNDPLGQNVGPLQLINGEEGHSPGFNFINFAHADLRLNGITQVPEPATIALLTAGLLGVGAARRKRI